ERTAALVSSENREMSLNGTSQVTEQLDTPSLTSIDELNPVKRQPTLSSPQTSGQVIPRNPDFVLCEGVCKAYGQREVLRGIDLAVRRGEVLTIMGPSGSGKSTFLRLINHLENLDSGKITVDGKYVGYRDNGGELTTVRDLARAR